MTRTRTAAAVAAAALGAGTLALTACGGSPDRADRLDPDVAFVGVVDPGWHGEAMVDASGRLASELLARADGNAVVSPLSLQLALALLREGATGAVADDIDTVAGLSGRSQDVADLRAMLARDFFVDPQVLVSVKEHGGQVYVTGEVKQPGMYGVRDGLTVLHACLLAGGFTDFASLR